MARRYEILVCNKRIWLNGHGIFNFKPPKFGDLVTVHDQRDIKGEPHISLEEHCPGKVYYALKHFRKPDQRELDHGFAEKVLAEISENRNYIN